MKENQKQIKVKLYQNTQFLERDLIPEITSAYYEFKGEQTKSKAVIEQFQAAVMLKQRTKAAESDEYSDNEGDSADIDVD